MARVEGVAHVGRGTPTLDEGVGSIPAIFVRYAGATWEPQATRYYDVSGRYQVLIVTGGPSPEEAEDSMFVLLDRVKAMIRANEDMQPRPGESYAYRSLIEETSPFEPVQSPEVLRCLVTLRIQWLERFSSEIGSSSLGVVGGGS